MINERNIVDLENVIAELGKLKTYNLNMADSMSELMNKDNLGNYVCLEDVIKTFKASMDAMNMYMLELQDNEVMGRKEASDECDFLHIDSMSMESLIDLYKDYEESYEKASAKYSALENENKLDGNTVYSYHFNKDIYEYLKGEIVRRTIDNYKMTKNTEISGNKEIMEDNPVVRGISR